MKAATRMTWKSFIVALVVAAAADVVQHRPAVGNPVAYRTHAERVAQRRREWKLRKTHKHAVAEKARAANATC